MHWHLDVLSTAFRALVPRIWCLNVPITAYDCRRTTQSIFKLRPGWTYSQTQTACSRWCRWTLSCLHRHPCRLRCIILWRMCRSTLRTPSIFRYWSSAEQPWCSAPATCCASSGCSSTQQKRSAPWCSSPPIWALCHCLPVSNSLPLCMCDLLVQVCWPCMDMRTVCSVM